MGLMSELNAVNRILRGAGEQPVSSLADDANDTAIAEQILLETSRQYQDGLFSSTRKGLVYPNEQGKIILPPTLIRIEGYKEHARLQIEMRGRNPIYLFNLDDNTAVFDEAINVKMTEALPFEDLPTLHQYAVADLAAVQYQMETQGDPAMDAALRRQAEMSVAKSKSDDTRSRKSNVLHSDDGVPYQIARRDRRYRSWWK